MNIQHSFWIMAQVPSFKAAIMSKAILLWRTAFLVRVILVFRKTRFAGCHLRLLAEFSWGFFCVCLKFSRSEEAGKVVKWSHRWEIECVHLALRRRRLASFISMGQILPYVNGKHRVQQPRHTGGSHKDLCLATIRIHLGRPNTHLGDVPG